MPNPTSRTLQTNDAHYTDGMIDTRRGYGFLLLTLIPLGIIAVIIFGIIKTMRTQEVLPYGESTYTHERSASGDPSPK